MTELGYRISQEPKKEYVIVSNDTGYDVVVRYWEQRDCKVRRIRGTECETMVAKLNAERERSEERRRKAEKDAEREQSEERRRRAEKKSERRTAAGRRAAAEPALDDMDLEIEYMEPEDEDMEPEIEYMEPEDDDLEPKDDNLESEDDDLESEDDDMTPEDDVDEPEYGSTEQVAARPESGSTGWNDQMTRVFQESGSRDAGRDMDFLTSLCKTVKVSNMSLMHNVLEYQFGQRVGNGIYRILKSDPACRSVLSAGYVNSKRQREREYLRLVLGRNGMSEVDADAILRIINGLPKKNLNAIHTSLVKKFGQEQGGRYYAALRSHVKIIRGL